MPTGVTAEWPFTKLDQHWTAGALNVTLNIIKSGGLC